MRKVAFLALFFMAGLSACGPDQRAVDKADGETREQYQKDAEKMTPLLGHYEGEWTSAFSDEPHQVVMDISMSNGWVKSGDHMVEVPMLDGYLDALIENSPPFHLGDIVSGNYDPSSGYLSLYLVYSTPDKNGGNGVTHDFEGTFRKDVIAGKFEVNGRPNKLVVKKVAQ